MICLTLTAGTLEENCELVRKNSEWIDIAELRLDLLDPGEMERARVFPDMVDIPLILTIRGVNEGGAFEGDDQTRLELLSRMVSCGFRYVDVDCSCNCPELEEAAEKAEVRIIRSQHMFNNMPQTTVEIEDILSGLKHSSRDIPKLALYPKTVRELGLIFDVPSTGERILLGMGDVGFPTRVLYRKTGSILTYTSAPGYSAAPGHTGPEDFALRYRVTDINRDTALFAIIGDPVMHSASPAFHNTGFAASRLNSVYVPFSVPKGPDNGDLKEFFTLAKKLSLEGWSVTVPHKGSVIPCLHEIDPMVEKIGACNTVVFKDGVGKGFNTDYQGFLQPLLDRGLVGPAGSCKTAAVIGAGGAARAAVFGLVEHGVKVVVYNRTLENALSLAREAGAEAAGLDDTGAMEKCDLLVQATSVGLNEEKTPVPGYTFHSEQTAYDLVYAPEQTLFLRQAAAQGCRVIRGKEMLREQGKMQYRLFTGKGYPV